MSSFNYSGNHVYMSCDDWENTRRTMASKHFEHVQYEWKRRAAYFRRQRALGCAVFIAGIVLILVGFMAHIQFLGYLGLTAGVLGMYIIIAKHMILVDEYYLECQSKMNMI